MFWENQDFIFFAILPSNRNKKKTFQFLISLIFQSLIVCSLAELNENL